MRGDSEPVSRRTSRRLRVSRSHYELVLREDGFLHGTGFIRSESINEDFADEQLTIMGMRHPEEPVALQAIEFWSTVCEEEIEMGVESQEVSCYPRLS